MLRERARFLFVCLALASALLAARPAAAHGLHAAYLEITEIDATSLRATLRTTDGDRTLRPRFADGCRIARTGEDGFETTLEVICRDPWAGTTLVMGGFGPSVHEVIIRLVRRDGTIATHIATRAAPTY